MSGLYVNWKKIVKLDTKLVNILNGNKLILFDYIFSTRKNNYLSLYCTKTYKFT